MQYVHPQSGVVAFFAERVLNSSLLIRLRRTVLGWLPFLRLKSDVRNVVYLNWVVPADRVAHLTPNGVRLREYDGKAVVSVLTYQHGHFAPACLGWLRRLFPSPLQSNWRLYVDQIDGQPLDQETVLFFTNCMSSLLYTAGARIFSDTLPCHLARSIQHTLSDARILTTIDPGDGSAPDLACIATVMNERTLPAEFCDIFPSWNAAVEYLCLQDAAVSAALGTDRLALSHIDLPIPVDRAQPLAVSEGSLKSNWLASIIEGATPLCFLIEEVQFQALSDSLMK